MQDNPVDGIVVDTNSFAFITSNTIQNHGDQGILVFRSSSAQIFENTISNNTTWGVHVSRLSHANIGGNAIDGNGLDGIFVVKNSGVDLEERGPNTTTVDNGGFGIRCVIDSYASGDVGTLNGASGQIGGTCDHP